MSDPQNAAVLALLSVLEQRAKKKGQKSIVKDVLRTLTEGGAGQDLIADVAALSPVKRTPAKAKADKGEPKSSARAKPRAKAKAGTKKKPAETAELAA